MAVGAMIAMELVHDGDADKPNAELTKAIVAEAAKNGLILLSCGIRGNVIRFLPALTITDDLKDYFLKPTALGGTYIQSLDLIAVDFTEFAVHAIQIPGKNCSFVSACSACSAAQAPAASTVMVEAVGKTPR